MKTIGHSRHQLICQSIRALPYSTSMQFPRRRLLPATQPIEEETISGYTPTHFYPVHIGETLSSPQSAYKVLGKLGYGRNSTVWLCRDLNAGSFYTVKVGTNLTAHDNQEARIYDHLKSIKTTHPGAEFVRTLHEAFELKGPDGSHPCLVHTPLGMNLSEFQDTFPDKRLPEEIVKGLLLCLLQALDFLHKEANVIHTDLQARNILISLADEEPLKSIAESERQNPSPCKIIDEHRTIYTSQALEFSFGNPTLCDFGLAVIGSEQEGLIQPIPFRAPEVILRMKWNSKVDIWNLGVLIWDLLFNQHLLDGKTECDQLERIIAYLGRPPAKFLRTSKESLIHFDEEGNWKGPEIKPTPLHESLEGGETRLFLDLMASMVTWLPADRKSAAELLAHPWLHSSDGVI